MRNICHLDFLDIRNFGVLNSACDQNSIILYLIPSENQKTHYRVEITGSNDELFTSEELVLGDDSNIDFLDYTINKKYWSSAGTMKVRLLSTEGNSNYVNFTISKAIADEDKIQVKLKDDCTTFDIFALVQNEGGGGITELPIATQTRLGGIKVGENLNITSDGTLSSTGEPGPPGPPGKDGELTLLDLKPGVFAMEVEAGHLFLLHNTTDPVPPLKIEDGRLKYIIDEG